MGSTAAEGGPHLGAGSGGPMQPLHSASGAKRHTVYSSARNELSRFSCGLLFI